MSFLANCYTYLVNGGVNHFIPYLATRHRMFTKVNKLLWLTVHSIIVGGIRGYVIHILPSQVANFICELVDIRCGVSVSILSKIYVYK